MADGPFSEVGPLPQRPSELYAPTSLPVKRQRRPRPVRRASLFEESFERFLQGKVRPKPPNGPVKAVANCSDRRPGHGCNLVQRHVEVVEEDDYQAVLVR